MSTKCWKEIIAMKSRVNREVHARFRESLGVKLPGESTAQNPPDRIFSFPESASNRDP